jgi:alpha/beta superfamily hydrolase
MTHLRAPVVLLGLATLVGCADSNSYLARRARFKTHLLVRGPVPVPPGFPDTTVPHLSLDSWRPWTWCGLDSLPRLRPTGSLDSVTYRSGALELPAWVYTPSRPAGQRLPALLYLHPGFNLTSQTAACATPFMAAGMVVMWPIYRGENGSSGNFELLLGEVDDAVAAARWLAAQPQVDARRVYAFGWSSGGGIAALLSLMDAPIRHSGSSGGMFGPNLNQLPKVPYDTMSVAEWEMRSLPANIRWMRHPHYAYVEQGEDDFWGSSLVLIERATRGRRTLLHLTMVPGTHSSIYPEAVRRYLNEILADGQAR